MDLEILLTPLGLYDNTRVHFLGKISINFLIYALEICSKTCLTKQNCHILQWLSNYIIRPCAIINALEYICEEGAMGRQKEKEWEIK